MQGNMLNIYDWISQNKYIGHRGLAAEAPENTLSSFRRAASRGLKVVEFDVMLSADQVPIVFHDEKLIRIAGIHEFTHCLTLAELKKLDVGSWYNPQFAYERIPTLEEVLNLCNEFHLGANVEIKPAPDQDVETAEIVLNFIKNFQFTHVPKPLISSFSMRALEYAWKNFPQFTRGLLVEKTVTSQHLMDLEKYQCGSLHCNQRWFDSNLVSQVKALDKKILVYTVNDFSQADHLFAIGVDGIFTDMLFNNIK